MEGNRYLLDTHCLIWFQIDSPRIPTQILNIIKGRDNTILFSQISLFEISIKQNVGKLLNLLTTVEEIY